MRQCFAVLYSLCLCPSESSGVHRLCNKKVFMCISYCTPVVNTSFPLVCMQSPQEDDLPQTDPSISSDGPPVKADVVLSSFTAARLLTGVWHSACPRILGADDISAR